MKKENTTITISLKSRKELEKLKVIPREAIGNVIKRLLEKKND